MQSRKFYWKESNRPRPTSALHEGDTLYDYTSRLIKEGKWEYKDDGVIYTRFDFRGKGSFRKTPKKLGYHRGHSHYVNTYVCFNGSYHTVAIHRIVYAYFHGLSEYKECEQINHINGVKNDNRIENLELVTPSENTRHAIINGLRKVENTNTAKLSWKEVAEIRKYLKEKKFTQKELAKMYGVDQTTISSIKLNKSWKEFYRDENKSKGLA